MHPKCVHESTCYKFDDQRNQHTSKYDKNVYGTPCRFKFCCIGLTTLSQGARQHAQWVRCLRLCTYCL